MEELKNKPQEMKIAVLIDGDNSSYQRVSEMLEEIAKYGVPTIKRIYGDFTKPNLEGWKSNLLDNAITPIQQYAYTTGKNATDSMMIIDAMDILYSKNVDGFCIVSSDSDFTRLAVRLREAGKFVIGMGEEKTPTPFIKSCDRFIYLSVITRQKSQPTKLKLRDIKELKEMVQIAIDDVADDSGYAFLADVGNIINKKHPDFDPRNYGYMKLSHLIKDLKDFMLDERPIGKSGVKHVYIKNRSEE